jgi:hypothetical protein
MIFYFNLFWLENSQFLSNSVFKSFPNNISENETEKKRSKEKEKESGALAMPTHGRVRARPERQSTQRTGQRQCPRFLFYVLMSGPHRHVIIFFKAGGERTSRTTSAFFSFFAIPLDLIPDDLRDHLTSRLILLKPHSLLRNIPQTTHTESPQAARIQARKSAVPSQFIVEFGKLGPPFDL